MRTLPAVLFLVACGAGNPALERRVAELEARRAPAPTKSPEVATLEIRVTALERSIAKLIAEQKEVQEVLEKVADQVADLLAEIPLPPPGPTPGPPGPPGALPPVRHGSLDPAKVYAVALADSPQLGPKTAAVTLVAAVQFPEPYTHKAWPIIGQLQSEYGKELRVVVKTFVVHTQATESSIAACAVANQKKLDAFETALWTAANPGSSRVWPDAAQSRDIAEKLGVDLTKFDKDVTHACRDGQLRDIKMFQALGQAAVPTFWINGRPLSGAQPVEAFRLVIDDEKQKAEADRKKGGKPATYYDRIIKTGAKTGP